MSRMVMLANGSYGVVAPNPGLGASLWAAGHEVHRAATWPNLPSPASRPTTVFTGPRVVIVSAPHRAPAPHASAPTR